jgi:hypothetical protein
MRITFALMRHGDYRRFRRGARVEPGCDQRVRPRLSRRLHESLHGCHLQTTFDLIAADPVQGQVSLQARVKIQGRNALVAVRLKIDRGQILEIEHLWAIPLLTTPRATLTADISPAERPSREVLLRAANSYFDALEGDDGRIAAFAGDCVRHENGCQTVNNPPPGWSRCIRCSFTMERGAARGRAIFPECCRIW